MQQRWGDYILWEQLNSGGMAEVFVATSPANAKVTIRRLKPEYKLNLFKRFEFTHGLEIQNQMDHPSIVKIHDLYLLKSLPYAVLEYIDGFNLREKMLQESFTTENRISILYQILEGLHYIHTSGHLHLDLKPENILIEHRGMVKIFDFDLAEEISEKPEPQREINGTPSYMAPEQILRQPIDERTDIFAFGLTAFELFTGRKAFAPKERHEIFQFYSELDTPFPKPRSIDENVPPEIDHLISRCIEKKADRRYPHASSILKELEALS